MHFWRQRMKGQASSVLDQEPAKGPPPRGSPSPRKFAFKKSPRRESREELLVEDFGFFRRRVELLAQPRLLLHVAEALGTRLQGVQEYGWE